MALTAGLCTPSAQTCRLRGARLRTGSPRSEQAGHLLHIICTQIHPPGAGHAALRLPQKQELHEAVRSTGDRRAAAHLKPHLHLGAPPARRRQTRTFRPLPARRACAPGAPCRPRLGPHRQWGRVHRKTGPVSGSSWEERGSRSTVPLSCIPPRRATKTRQAGRRHPWPHCSVLGDTRAASHLSRAGHGRSSQMRLQGALFASPATWSGGDRPGGPHTVQTVQSEARRSARGPRLTLNSDPGSSKHAH